VCNHDEELEKKYVENEHVLDSIPDNFIINVGMLKYDWTEGRQEVCRLEEDLDKDAVYHQFCST
jgi:hypothetical protein